jgi:hypothetical protein
MPLHSSVKEHGVLHVFQIARPQSWFVCVISYPGQSSYKLKLNNAAIKRTIATRGEGRMEKTSRVPTSTMRSDLLCVGVPSSSSWTSRTARGGREEESIANQKYGNDQHAKARIGRFPALECGGGWVRLEARYCFV